jgi:hypothetical protein
MKRILLSIVVLLLAACAPVPQPRGILEGYVTVGPLSPVVRADQPEPTPGPEVYAQRQVVVYDEKGTREIARVQIGGQGNYRVELPAGTYTVDINHLGIDYGVGLPKQVVITPNATTRLDIEIDTGIR